MARNPENNKQINHIIWHRAIWMEPVARIYPVLSFGQNRLEHQKPTRRRTTRHSIRMRCCQPVPFPRYPQKHEIPRLTERPTPTTYTPKNRRRNPPLHPHRPKNMGTNPKKNPIRKTASRHMHRKNKLRSSFKNKGKWSLNLCSRRRWERYFGG